MRQAVEDDDYFVHVETQGVVSKLQQMKKLATVAAAVAKKVLKHFKKTASRGLVFRSGIMCWQLGDFVIGSVCDASHADEHCERTGEPYTSQGGGVTLLATRGLVDETECGFQVIACASNTLKRVCRSTHAHSGDVGSSGGLRQRAP